ncbi:hypothetical protein CMO88_03805 [Candidatus Woesearchaeota archaeon]|nr:hypothetical protein [Candidatus Woesearchaeota archaeon]|tara:strand:- start:25686 stop:26681 length:996 start_codon:yes stop_codon:yes gene_type:complete
MDVMKILKENSKEVNSELRKFLPKHHDIKAINEVLTKPTWDLLNRGGKQWRPLLMFLSCSSVGGNPKSIAKFSVIPELIHNGTLIADDVEDNSITRRNKATIHRKYGVDVAVNLSSMLYYLPLSIIKNSKLDNEIKIKIYELVNEELLKMHFGQGTDIYWHKTLCQVSENQYFAMCANKAGTLARLSAKLGAILGNGTDKQVFALGKFAEAIGVAFQIQDDVLNLRGGLGKAIGEDITESKMSLPVIRTLSIANSNDKKELIEILKKHTSNKNEISYAIGVINKYRSLEYSRDVADKIIKKSWSELEPELFSSEAKNKLNQLAKFMVEREI